MSTAGTDTNERYTLRRCGAIHWTITDTSGTDGRPDHVIAHVYEYDEFEYDVVWTGALQLLAHYSSPQDALSDVLRSVAVATRVRSERPTPIAHRRPASSGQYTLAV